MIELQKYEKQSIKKYEEKVKTFFSDPDNVNVVYAVFLKSEGRVDAQVKVVGSFFTPKTEMSPVYFGPHFVGLKVVEDDVIYSIWVERYR